MGLDGAEGSSGVIIGLSVPAFEHGEHFPERRRRDFFRYIVQTALLSKLSGGEVQITIAATIIIGNTILHSQLKYFWIIASKNISLRFKSSQLAFSPRPTSTPFPLGGLIQESKRSIHTPHSSRKGLLGNLGGRENNV